MLLCGHFCLRAVLIEQLFPRFSSCFPKINRKSRGNISKVWKILEEGKLFGTLRIPIFGNKNGKYGNTKKLGEKNLES